MITSTIIAINYRSIWIFPTLMIVGAFISLFHFYIIKKRTTEIENQQINESNSKPLYEINTKIGKILLIGFIVIIISLLLLRIIFGNKLWTPLKWLEIMVRMGSLIFGGGQVVIPMLLEELVSTGIITQSQFMDGKLY
jgi:chromate transporter